MRPAPALGWHDGKIVPAPAERVCDYLISTTTTTACDKLVVILEDVVKDVIEDVVEVIVI